MQTMKYHELDYFFNAQSVAVVGASSKKGKIGFEILRSMTESDYKGEIYPINPKEEKILGKKVYKSLSEIPGKVDLAVMAIASSAVPSAIEEAGKKGVKAVVIISGGFRELGEDTAKLEKEAVENAKKWNIRIIGPNCIGIFNSANSLDTFFQPREQCIRPKKGDVAILTQSGTYGLSIMEWLDDNGLGVSKFVSYGNKCDVDEVDMLNYLENDEDTKVIAIYMEGLRDGKLFFETAKRVSRKKPIVLFKTGRTSEGAKAASSHTGALAGNDGVFTGAMAQSGIILADDIEELVDIVKILAMQPLPEGNTVGMTSNGAGPCVAATDYILRSKSLKIGKLSENTKSSLKKKLSEFCVIANPIDITGSADASWYDIAMKALAEDENISILLPFFVFQNGPVGNSIDELHTSLQSLRKYGKTLVCGAAGGPYTLEQARKCQANRIPVIPTAKRAISALDKIFIYAQWKKKHS